MKAIFFLPLFAPMFLTAQEVKENSKSANKPASYYVTNVHAGIVWTDNLTWKQVRKRAKKENKCIFVDCFTTWCGPCKKMDKEVYENDSVGSFLNAGFISIKVQMDSTKTDNELTRSWYKTAKEMKTTYNVADFPTFLFFSSDGKIIYKDTGYRIPSTFMQVVQNAITPSKQYYTLLRMYKKGKMDFLNMPYLILMSRLLGDTNYLSLLTDYYSYLQSQNIQYTKENIEFIASTLESSDQAQFTMFYPDEKAVDNMMKKTGYARNVVDRIIFKEKCIPFLSAAEGKPEPDWNILYNSIVNDYIGDYADRVVLNAKMKYYLDHGNMIKYAIALNDKIEKYGSDSTGRTKIFH